MDDAVLGARKWCCWDCTASAAPLRNTVTPGQASACPLQLLRPYRRFIPTPLSSFTADSGTPRGPHDASLTARLSEASRRLCKANRD